MIRFRKYVGKRIGIALLTLLSSIIYQESILAQSEESVNTTEARSIVKQYFDALMLGDVVTASGLLDKKLLEEKMTIFSNPTYPQFLQRFYKNARFEIIDASIKGDTVAVDVIITHQNKDASQFRLWLRNDNSNTGLRIFMETN